MRKCAEDFWQTRRIFPKKKLLLPGLRMGNLQNGEIDWSNLMYTDDKDDIENIREKLASLKETVIEEPKLRLIEEKLSDYREKSRSLLKNKHFFMGNRRIVDAFPTMRFIPKNKSSISVKEMIGYINTKVKKNNKD